MSYSFQVYGKFGYITDGILPEPDAEACTYSTTISVEDHLTMEEKLAKLKTLVALDTRLWLVEDADISHLSTGVMPVRAKDLQTQQLYCFGKDADGTVYRIREGIETIVYTEDSDDEMEPITNVDEYFLGHCSVL